MACYDEILGPDTGRTKQVLLEKHQKLNQLSYISAVIKETLRLHTPAATLRKAIPGFQLVHNGTTWPILKDAVVQTMPHALRSRATAGGIPPGAIFSPGGPSLTPYQECIPPVWTRDHAMHRRRARHDGNEAGAHTNAARSGL